MAAVGNGGEPELLATSGQLQRSQKAARRADERSARRPAYPRGGHPPYVMDLHRHPAEGPGRRTF